SRSTKLNSDPLASSVPRIFTLAIDVQRVNHVPQNRSRANYFSTLLGARAFERGICRCGPSRCPSPFDGRCPHLNDVAKVPGKDPWLFRTMADDRDHFASGIDINGYTAKVETITLINSQSPLQPLWQATVLSFCTDRRTGETTSRLPVAPQADLEAR
ncbi:MAG: hypothetical protein K9G71_17830, partial [Rhodobacteraceae bacterium]|nr:hypothetical protein [Paracoccaceae bacterium]MCF8516130.1 hypothetical protein [Paracoccaceae bacterium]MCF8520580.1 hypothetical protein [Paracoccaceae bacterium]